MTGSSKGRNQRAEVTKRSLGGSPLDTVSWALLLLSSPGQFCNTQKQAVPGCRLRWGPWTWKKLSQAIKNKTTKHKLLPAVLEIQVIILRIQILSYSHHSKDKIGEYQTFTQILWSKTQILSLLPNLVILGTFFPKSDTSWIQDNWEIRCDFYQAEIAKVQLATPNTNPEQKAPHDPSGTHHQTVLFRYRTTSAQSIFLRILKCT